MISSKISGKSFYINVVNAMCFARETSWPGVSHPGQAAGLSSKISVMSFDINAMSDACFARETSASCFMTGGKDRRNARRPNRITRQCLQAGAIPAARRPAGQGGTWQNAGV
ncbi:hypothetical protein ABIE69_002644 [Rhodobacteraceae bacterium MBR-64]